MGMRHKRRQYIQASRRNREANTRLLVNVTRAFTVSSPPINDC